MQLATDKAYLSIYYMYIVLISESVCKQEQYFDTETQWLLCNLVRLFRTGLNSPSWELHLSDE